MTEELKNQDFCYIPREVSNIPEVRVGETKAIRQQKYDSDWKLTVMQLGQLNKDRE